MTKPFSKRAAKLLEDPDKTKLLMEYLGNPSKRDTQIILVPEDDDNLGIYTVDEENKIYDAKGNMVGERDKNGVLKFLEHAS